MGETSRIVIRIRNIIFTSLFQRHTYTHNEHVFIVPFHSNDQYQISEAWLLTYGRPLHTRNNTSSKRRSYTFPRTHKPARKDKSCDVERVTSFKHLSSKNLSKISIIRVRNHLKSQLISIFFYKYNKNLTSTRTNNKLC